jgi:hypothetical protein
MTYNFSFFIFFRVLPNNKSSPKASILWDTLYKQ